MAVIHILSLDVNTERAIRNKQYCEEQVAELNKKIQADTKKKKKAFWITMIIVAVLFFGYGTFVLKKTIGFPQALPIILSFIPIMVIIGAVSWFAAAGNIMRKWNNLIKVFYPSVYAMRNEE